MAKRRDEPAYLRDEQGRILCERCRIAEPTVKWDPSRGQFLCNTCWVCTCPIAGKDQPPP